MDKLNELQENYVRRNNRKFYEEIGNIRKGFVQQAALCKHKDGKIIAEKMKIIAR